MLTFRVLYSFTRLPDAALQAFAGSVVAKMTGNAGYPTPRVALVALNAIATGFGDAITAAIGGGKMLTAEKNAAREALMGVLRQEASYVQSVAGEDLALLLSS